jgi:hypothetical protein
MTETEWQQSTDPDALLNYLKGRLSDRKLRLLACACAWRQWPSITDERSRQAVYRAERFADGEASAEELQRARHTARRAARKQGLPEEDPRRLLWFRLWDDPGPMDPGPGVRDVWRGLATLCAEAAVLPTGAAAARLAVETLVPDAVTAALRHRPPEHWTHSFYLTNRQAVCALVRDIAGNPFRPVTLQPSWLTWHNGWARQMARVMYGQRKFADLPIVADALEDAGCDDAAVLDHCRAGGEHVRGCWLVDLLLGKE